MTGHYNTAQVAKMLSISEAQVRGYVKAGFLTPLRDTRGSLWFSFQQLVVLKTAKALSQARVPPRRVKTALRKLLDQLPQGRPLTTVTISAEGGKVVVRDERSRWRPDDGQQLFDFEVRDLAKRVAPLARKNAAAAKAAAPDLGAEDWYALGCELEITSIDEARDAYRRAIELEPAHADAHCNLGRLLHESGEAEAASAHYELALQANPDHATAWFNLGVAQEDSGALAKALHAYERALVLDGGNADAHFNVARLYQKMDKPMLALRHMRAYQKLIGSSAP